ncbi:MAG: DUF3198 domain-containing protein [Candidatus Thermoplasmatota archaeon]|jgi:hypothetical protein|nr:DUF3198 domain-containing protein [Candidatus Thermoplasmatota archaeon]MCL5988123.1 DUF3198 domain-containing protein [Candidatus Thermoplasmatota archaeon]
MQKIFRSLMFYFYFIATIVTLGIFVISSNDLIFQNTDFSTIATFSSAGNWNYWILIISFLLFLFFLYYTYAWIKDDIFFNQNLNSDSKAGFLKNMRKLEKIAMKHGGFYNERLKEKKASWKIK